ncbi:MAG TPA: hypothetical protein VKB38_23140 [Terracidiphilus sp.]|nr:hypothetical protein [Terracidiphilus sp.]
MAPAPTTHFTHRFNPDGTVDSICCDCFATVETANREEELKESEQGHVCDPWLRSYYEVIVARKVG